MEKKERKKEKGAKRRMNKDKQNKKEKVNGKRTMERRGEEQSWSGNRKCDARCDSSINKSLF